MKRAYAKATVIQLKYVAVYVAAGKTHPFQHCVSLLRYLSLTLRALHSRISRVTIKDVEGASKRDHC